jgi:hypothetical protein
MVRLGKSLWNYLGYVIHGDLGDMTSYTRRDGTLVIFPRTMPKEPASPDQIKTRNRIRIAGLTWREFDQAQRDLWNLAASRAHLRFNGYILFCHWLMTADSGTIETIARQARIPIGDLIE